MTSSDIALGDSVRERALGYIRTGVPVAVGSLLAWLVGRIPAVADFLDGFAPDWRSIVSTLATALVIFLYYALARWLGKRWPRVETILLGSSKQPVYVLPAVSYTASGTSTQGSSSV